MSGERAPNPASDSSVHSTIGAPPPAAGVGYPYAPDYNAANGLTLSRNGMPSGLYGPPTTINDPVKVLDPLSLLMALKRRWFLALTLGLLTGAMAAAAVWNLWPPILGGAQIQLMVNAVSPYIFMQEPTGDFNVFKRTQSMMVRGRRILDTAVKKPHVAELRLIRNMGDPVRALEQRVWADFNMGPETLTVSLPAQPEDVEDARIIVDAIVDTYLAERKENSHHVRRLRVLERMYRPYADAIKSKRESLDALTKALAARDPHLLELQLQFTLRRLNAAETKLLELMDKREAEQFELEQCRDQLKQASKMPAPTKEEIDQVVNLDPTYKELKEKITKEEEEVEKMIARLAGGKTSKTYTKLRDGLAKDKIRLNKLYDELKTTAENRIKEARTGGLMRRIGELEVSVAARAQLEERVQKAMEILRRATQTYNLTSQEADVLKAQIDADQTIAGKLAHEMDALRLELNAPDRVSKFSDAYTYPPVIGRKQIMATWAAGVGAFGLVLFGISWWEFRGRRISSVDEVVNNLGLRVVGALPALPDRRGRHMPSRDAFYPNYLIESVDTTRTMLLHAARRESLRAVMVTSANSGEGKTSLSIQLAASLARAGRKTLLIDGDVRNPAAHQVFNLSREPGFNELVRGEVEIPATLQATTVRNLWVMPAGRWNPHTTEVLSQEAVVPILQRLKEEFDFIIIDSSPVLAAVDSLLVGQQVDAVIFSILHEVSHSPSVFAAHQRLESLGVRILGAVVNGVESAQLGHKTEYVYEEEVLSPDEESDEEEL
jgi:capsular exopolysaccharide synthesis family protein